MQPPGLAPGHFQKQRGFRFRFQHHQQVAEIRSSRLPKRVEHVKRLLHPHASGHVEQRSRGPERTVQRGKAVVAQIDHLAQVGLDRLGVLGGQRSQRAEKHPGIGRLGIQLLLDHAAVHGAYPTGHLDPLGQQRLGSHFRRGRGPGQGEPLQVKRADVGSPPFFFISAGPGHLLELLEALAALLQQPVRFLKRAEELLERLGVPSGGCGGSAHGSLLPGKHAAGSIGRREDLRWGGFAFGGSAAGQARGFAGSVTVQRNRLWPLASPGLQSGEARYSCKFFHRSGSSQSPTAVPPSAD